MTHKWTNKKELDYKEEIKEYAWVKKKELEYERAIKNNEFYSAHECLDLLKEIIKLRRTGRSFKF